MLSYGIKQFVYSLTVFVVLAAILFSVYKQPIVQEKADAFFAEFRLYMERFAVKPPAVPDAFRKQQEVPLVLQQKSKVSSEPEVRVAQTVTLITPEQTYIFGFDEDEMLVQVLNEDIPVLFYPGGERYKRIVKKNKPIDFWYGERSLLTNITTPKWQLSFHYDKYDRVSVLVAPDKKVRMDWDIKDQLLSVQINQGLPTTFTYNDKKQVTSFKKTARETSVRYDEKGRTRGFDSDDDHLVIHYWRDNLMSSFSGSKYGLKETINYGPTEIKLVSDSDHASVTEGTETARIKVFNFFLTCKKIKHVPVIFDPTAWVIYQNYFKTDSVDYFVNNVLCNTVFETEFT